MTENFVAHRLLIDYSLNIGYIQWLINWLLIDFLLMTHWFHWCHQLVTFGKQLSYRPNTLFVDEFLSTPRSAFFPQYFKSCDLRQWGISDVKKNGVRWTFVRSLELKRPKTRVFLLNNLPDKVQKNLNKEDVRFWYLEIFFSKYTCWWWCVWCSAKLFHTVLCFY